MNKECLEALNRLDADRDLKYDCLIQVIEEEYGDDAMQSLHRKARMRYEHIQSSTKTHSQQADAQAEKPDEFLTRNHTADI